MRNIRGDIYEQDREMRNIRSRYLWTRQGNEKYKKGTYLWTRQGNEKYKGIYLWTRQGNIK